MRVVVFNQQKDLPLKVASVRSAAKEIVRLEDFKTDELIIHFVTVPAISLLHQQFFNDPSPTDCISFPLDNTEEQSSNYQILGEIFVCPKIAIDYIQSHPAVKHSIYHETTLYMLHGILHLIGYEDINEKDRRKMRNAEKKHLENLIHKKLLLKAP